MNTLINFMLGALLAAALIAPQVWTDFGKGTQSRGSVAAPVGHLGRHLPTQAALQGHDASRNS